MSEVSQFLASNNNSIDTIFQYHISDERKTIPLVSSKFKDVSLEIAEDGTNYQSLRPVSQEKGPLLDSVYFDIEFPSSVDPIHHDMIFNFSINGIPCILFFNDKQKKALYIKGNEHEQTGNYVGLDEVETVMKEFQQLNYNVKFLNKLPYWSEEDFTNQFHFDEVYVDYSHMNDALSGNLIHKAEHILVTRNPKTRTPGDEEQYSREVISFVNKLKKRGNLKHISVSITKGDYVTYANLLISLFNMGLDCTALCTSFKTTFSFVDGKVVLECEMPEYYRSGRTCGSKLMRVMISRTEKLIIKVNRKTEERGPKSLLKIFGKESDEFLDKLDSIYFINKHLDNYSVKITFTDKKSRAKSAHFK